MNANKSQKSQKNQTFKLSESPLFNLGQIVATPGALKRLEDHGVQAVTLLNRHVHGDWRSMAVEDQKANFDAVKDGSRVFSSYCVDAQKIWVITEAVGDDGFHASSCILMPSEY